VLQKVQLCQNGNFTQEEVERIFPILGDNCMELDLRRCTKMTQLPSELGYWTKLDKLYLPDTIEPQMLSIFNQQGTAGLLQFMRDTISNGIKTKWNQIKIITLGNGRIGKTTLLRVLNSFNNSNRSKAQSQKLLKVMKRVFNKKDKQCLPAVQT